MPDVPVQYWDSTVFLTFLRADNAERVRVIRSLLHAHEAGKFRMLISTFTIAEVRSMRLEGSDGPVPGNEGTEQRHPHVEAHVAIVRELFDSNRLIYWTVTGRVAQIAADIGNQYVSLLPGDCVHIATAIAAHADVLFTYDGAGQRRRPSMMLRYDGKIGDPPLSIKEPTDMWPTLGLETAAASSENPSVPSQLAGQSDVVPQG